MTKLLTLAAAPKAAAASRSLASRRSPASRSTTRRPGQPQRQPRPRVVPPPAPQAGAQPQPNVPAPSQPDPAASARHVVATNPFNLKSTTFPCPSIAPSPCSFSASFPRPARKPPIPARRHSSGRACSARRAATCSAAPSPATSRRADPRSCSGRPAGAPAAAQARPRVPLGRDQNHRRTSTSPNSAATPSPDSTGNTPAAA